MNAQNLWGRVLVILGGLAMLLGALDPLEGSVVILAGSAFVALGTCLDQAGRRLLWYWVVTFILIALGISAMFALSAIGGIGGTSGHSMWWGILVLPYPIGWIMGIVSLLFRLFRSVRHRPTTA